MIELNNSRKENHVTCPLKGNTVERKNDLRYFSLGGGGRFTKKFFSRAILMLLLVISFNALTAQQRFQAGIVLGVTASQINGDNSAQFNKLGLTAGLKVNTILTNKSDFIIEILLSQRGSQTELLPRSGALQQTIHLDYIQVPVLFNYKDWLSEEEDYYKMHFQGGLSYGRLFSTRFDNSPIEEAGPFFRKDDISWMAGMTFFANEHLGFFARYNRSINLLFKNSSSNPNVNSLLSYFLSFGANYVF